MDWNWRRAPPVTSDWVIFLIIAGTQVGKKYKREKKGFSCQKNARCLGSVARQLCSNQKAQIELQGHSLSQQIWAGNCPGYRPPPRWMTPLTPFLNKMPLFCWKWTSFALFPPKQTEFHDLKSTALPACHHYKVNPLHVSRGRLKFERCSVKGTFWSRGKMYYRCCKHLSRVA